MILSLPAWIGNSILQTIGGHASSRGTDEPAGEGGNRMNTLQAVARILKTEGVEWISCFPSNNLIEAVAQEGIRPIMFRQERGAIMAADGYSRMNNRKKFGVIITQGGPGSENCMGGLAQAFADNVPVLYLPGGPAVNQHSVCPSFSPARSYASV